MKRTFYLAVRFVFNIQVKKDGSGTIFSRTFKISVLTLVAFSACHLFEIMHHAKPSPVMKIIILSQ